MTDLLSNVVMAINASGSVVAVELYEPYGTLNYSWGTMPTSHNYTDQRLDSQSGLIYYNFRWYDPVTGQFVRTDTKQNNANGFDPYAYVNDNPETKNDPTGHWGWGTIALIVAVVVVVAVVAVVAALVLIAAAGATAEVAADGAVVGGIAEGTADVAGAATADTVASTAADATIDAAADTTADAVGDTAGDVSADASTDTSADASSDVSNKGGNGCDALSFRASTLVATAQGEHAISTLHVGDKVWSYNPQAKKMELEPIQKVWLNHDTDLVDLTLVATVKDAQGKMSEQKEVIHTNEKHPFRTKEKGFIPVSQLKPGMHVLEADGSYGMVAQLVIVPGAMWMYNLTVAQDHTYAVGIAQWIVHNCPDGEGNNSGPQKGQNWTGNDQRPTLYRRWNGDGSPPGNDLRFPGNPAKPNATNMDVFPDANGDVQPGSGYSTSTQPGSKGTWVPIPGDKPLPPGLRATYDGGGHVTVGPDNSMPVNTLVNLWDLFMQLAEDE